jgi:hypothetical protein
MNTLESTTSGTDSPQFVVRLSGCRIPVYGEFYTLSGALLKVKDLAKAGIKAAVVLKDGGT